VDVHGTSPDVKPSSGILIAAIASRSPGSTSTLSSERPELRPDLGSRSIASNRIHVSVRVHLLELVSQYGFSHEVTPTLPKSGLKGHLTALERLPANVDIRFLSECRKKGNWINPYKSPSELDDRRGSGRRV
jgi:hypothetical protein